jgi:hypothetical protein
MAKGKGTSAKHVRPQSYRVDSGEPLASFGGGDETGNCTAFERRMPCVGNDLKAGPGPDLFVEQVV